jgi:hypothetical protein
MKTLQDIFDYINDRLIDGQADGLKSLIEYMNEGQALIVQKYPIEAPKLTVTLTSNVFAVPADMETLKKIVRNKATLNEVEIWNGEIILNENIKDGTVDVYYYKTPARLEDTSPSQIPDIDSRYFYSLAKYVSGLFYLAEDDADMREAFNNSFLQSLNSIAPKNTITKFKNGW